MQIVSPSTELMQGLKAIGSEMLTDWQTAAGTEGAALLKAYQQ